jgi:hypothetical protein
MVPGLHLSSSLVFDFQHFFFNKFHQQLCEIITSLFQLSISVIFFTVSTMIEDLDKRYLHWEPERQFLTHGMCYKL